MKYGLILAAVLLSGCTTTVPVKRNFPPVPPELLKQCQELQKIEAGKNSIADMLKTVVTNYTLYYECSNRVEGWQEWYTEQKRIYESVK